MHDIVLARRPAGYSTVEGATPHEMGTNPSQGHGDFWKTLAGVFGNVLEWYDFAVFGFLSDVIGQVFFPAHQTGDTKIIESFLIFGGAFLMRPIGGLTMGYIGDTYGRKRALVLSIFLMAFPTFLMGCLPSYDKAGALSIVLLILVRLLQGFSVGGQLMSSAVFTLERHDNQHWGYYGSLVMAAANFGTLLGSFAGWALRSFLTHDQLYRWGWRLPFLSGIVVSLSGFYLRGEEEEELHGGKKGDNGAPVNPIKMAFARHNLRSLLASAMVPMLWSSGFYLSFVWMAIFMADLIDNPVPSSFGINAMALFFSVCLFFPVAGMASDRLGRRRVMTVGGLAMGSLGPLMIVLIGKGNAVLALVSQFTMGIALSCWGAPMIAWLVESFEPQARLTSVAIGYNLAQATIGGLTPALATFMVDAMGPASPGIILTALSVVSLLGLWVVQSPVQSSALPSSQQDGGEASSPNQPSTRRRKKEVFSSVPSEEDIEDLPDLSLNFA